MRDGWRYNDNRTEILYTAEVEALSILEVVARPGWETVVELNVAAIEVPDGSIVNLSDLAITLPSNWNQRPVARNAQRIGAEFLSAVDRAQRDEAFAAPDAPAGHGSRGARSGKATYRLCRSILVSIRSPVSPSMIWPDSCMAAVLSPNLSNCGTKPIARSSIVKQPRKLNRSFFGNSIRNRTCWAMTRAFPVRGQSTS